MLADIEAKIVTAAPVEKSRLQNQAEVFREWLSAARTRRTARTRSLIGVTAL
jgi:hypothetical protein